MALRCGLPLQAYGCQSSMSRMSSMAKRYTGSSYTSHYGSSCGSTLGSCCERDRLPYKSPPSSYTSPGYLSTNTGRDCHCGGSPEPERGRPLPRTDLLGNRRSESLSRALARGCGPGGLSGGGACPSYSHSPARPGYLSASPAASPRLPLGRRRSVSQTDLTRDLASLGFADTPASPRGARRNIEGPRSAGRTRPSEAMDSCLGGRSSYAISRSSTQEAIGSMGRSWERASVGRPTSPGRETTLPLFGYRHNRTTAAGLLAACIPCAAAHGEVGSESGGGAEL
ncbi:hypothetical protein Z043_102610 [Scleropages formosus]|uniref:Uncharacterized protein n=1 Tax=Scleropages formosus TaxID=113540 RepID=A0A0P7V701_SCLFO|nr:hypothetical protein Z043_102610 [Scleropages formosus]